MRSGQKRGARLLRDLDPWGRFVFPSGNFVEFARRRCRVTCWNSGVRPIRYQRNGGVAGSGSAR